MRSVRPRRAPSRVEKPGRETITYRDVDPLLLTLNSLVDGDAVRNRLESRIITICLPLAKHIALRFKGRGEALEDLEQVARIGLVNAVNRFDPSKGSSFLSFAIPTMMGEVRRYFRDRSWSVSVPRAAKENHLRIGPAVEDLTSRLGRAPTIDEIAREIGLGREAVNDALLAGFAHTPESIDATHAGSDDERTMADRLAVDDTGFEFVDQFLSVKPLLALLSDEQRAVLKMRFFDEMTQSQIATKLGCSQMQISRMLARTLQFLRERASVED
ncbi:SigB/SigF/SigG family RNA polymerase sigma factor [Smaragdicoccus niigatensis]|uniref:SigB/SigF/SigG family RNA polymerase sigma factor n=1 Tax=Smaragdicoccus niigatensis TaxID=359359 RepID=UPI000364914D|nr:SigB/SigF/SigG family RNA polymerase sigma factor [Smaragdicoccus niigatensis]